MSVLELTWRLRPGATNVGRFGGSQTERHHLDFVVDGEPLFDTLRAADYDFIGCLGWAVEGQDAATTQRLLLEAPAAIPGGRHLLFVCAECGDLGCGAITAEIALRGCHIVWHDFAYENNYDPRMTERERFRRAGPFVFDPGQYAEALRNRPPRQGA